MIACTFLTESFPLAVEAFKGYAKVKSVGYEFDEQWYTYAFFIKNNFEILEDTLNFFKLRFQHGDRFIYACEDGSKVHALMSFLMHGSSLGLFKWTRMKERNKFLIEATTEKRKLEILYGKWFEIYLEAAAKRAVADSNDTIVVRNAIVKFKNGAIAEIDVAIRVKDELYIVEAKSGKYSKAEKYRRLINYLGIPVRNFIIAHAEGKVQWFDGYFVEDMKVNSFIKFFKEWIWEGVTKP